MNAPLSNPSPDDGRDPGASGRNIPEGHDAPGPLSQASSPDDGTKSARGHGHRINPARLEVRVRRIALLGLVLVPLIYFIMQSLR